MIEEQKFARVLRISWERILLHMEIELSQHKRKEEELRFYLVNEAGRAKAFFKYKSLGNGRYALSMNVTNPGTCRCVEEGQYRLIVAEAGKLFAKATLEPAFAKVISGCSRDFLYQNQTKAYVVHFSIEENEEELPLMIQILDAARGSLDLLHNKALVRGAIGTCLKTIKGNAGRMFWRGLYSHYAWRYRQKKNTVLFLSEQGEVIGKNLQAVKERMIERGLDQEYTLLTSARPASYKPLPKSSMVKFLKNVAKADTIFLDDHVPTFDWILLHKKTKVIQLWHAGAGFKSAGYSRWGHLGCPAPMGCHRQYRYGVAGSRKIAKFFSEVYGINDEQVLPTGMPRMDEYLDAAYQEKKKQELYEKYPGCRGKKVILFAPTYRGKKRADAYYPYEKIDFERLYEFCVRENYAVVFKMHPWVAEAVPIKEEHKDLFVDANTYGNINDLFYVTDVLVSDYSSNIYEYSLMRKPMLFFAFDKVLYATSRGFHRDYDATAPGKVCETFDDLMKALEQEDYEYEKLEQYIEEQFDHMDSNASDRVIDWMLLGQVPEDILEQERVRRQQLEEMHAFQL